MAISFVFLETNQMEVPLNREIPLDKAILLLEKQNQIAKQEEQEMFFSYALKENDQQVYQSTGELPKDSYDLFSAIVAEIESGDFDEEQKGFFLQWVAQAFHRKIKKAQPIRQEKEPRQPKEKKVRKKKRLPKVNKKFGLAFFLFLLCCLVGGGVFYAVTQKPVQPSLSTLLKEEKYLEAGKEYPNETMKIENELFTLTRTKDKKYLDQLKSFNREFETKQGTFDLAMFAYDYEKAISVYEENPKEFSSDSERLTLVGYAYLKINQLEKAQDLSKVANDPELEKFILQYKQATLIINEKKKEIDELQKHPTENKTKIEQAIEELYEAKEKLNQF